MAGDLLLAIVIVVGSGGKDFAVADHLREPTVLAVGVEEDAAPFNRGVG